MADPLIARRDLAFLLFDWLKVDDRETIDAVLDLAEQVATDLFLPHYREADTIEPRLDRDGVHILPAVVEALRRHAELACPRSASPSIWAGWGWSRSSM